MALEIITNASAADWIPQVWAQEVLANLRNYLVLAKYCNRDYDSEVRQMGNVVNVPVPIVTTAQAKPVSASGATTLTLDTIPVTLDQWITGGQVRVPDLARIQSRPDIMRQLVSASAIALAEKVETDLWALAVSAATTVGTAGTAVTPAIVAAARQKLVEGKVPQSEAKYLALSPKDYTAILTNANITNALNYGGSEGVRSGQIPTLYGMSLFESQLSPVIAGVPTQRNLAFCRDFMTLVTRPLEAPMAGTGVLYANVVDTESGLSFRMTISYDQNQGHLFDLDMLYGVDVLRAGFGVLVLG